MTRNLLILIIIFTPLGSFCAEKLAYHSDYFSFAGRDAIGFVTFALDNNRGVDGAYAGAWHLVIAVSQADRLAELEYDFANLKTVMRREDLTTLQLVWRESTDLFHSRNPFPVGGVFEDPATAAAAAALGGYLRAANLINVPTTILIHQGEAMGRSSRIIVQIPTSGGIIVSGTAVRI